MRALVDWPYGRCVYGSGSDVVDHQTVTMELSSGATAVLVMNGHSPRQVRTARYHGTRGSALASFGPDPRIEFTDHLGGIAEQIPFPAPGGGHGGGDTDLLDTFLEGLGTGMPTKTSNDTWFESHLLAFGAEEARVTGDTLDIDRMRTTGVAE